MVQERNRYESDCRRWADQICYSTSLGEAGLLLARKPQPGSILRSVAALHTPFRMGAEARIERHLMKLIEAQNPSQLAEAFPRLLPLFQGHMPRVARRLQDIRSGHK